MRTCLVCSKQFNSNASVIKHTFDHGNLSILCLHCKKTFKGHLQLRAHVKKYHKDHKAMETEEQQQHGYIQDHSDEISQEEMEEDDDDDENDIEQVTWIGGRSQEGTAAEQEDILKCPICEEIFEIEAEYESHIKDHYSLKQDTQCLLCPKTFTSINSTIVHTHEHSKRQVPCPFCGKRYRSRFQLRSHKNKYHASQEVEWQKAMEKEMRAPPPPNSDPPEIINCPICYAMFDVEERYDSHIKNHFAASDRKCLLCDQSFSAFWMLLNHIEEHSGREIPCQYCTKVFNTRFKQKKHVNKYHREDEKKRKDGGIDPPVLLVAPNLFCYYCEEGFATMDQMTEHVENCPSKDIVEEEQAQDQEQEQEEQQQEYLVLEQREQEGSSEAREGNDVVLVNEEAEDCLECPICQEVPHTEKAYEEHIKSHYKAQTVSSLVQDHGRVFC